MTHEHDDDDIELDKLMRTAFADARPDAGLEDRVVAGLRAADRWRMPHVHPMVRRAAVGVAAAILLGTAGFVATRVDEQPNRIKSASNLRQIGQSIQAYANENKGQIPQMGYGLTPNDRFVRREAGESQVELLVDGAQSTAGKDLASPRDMSRELREKSQEWGELYSSNSELGYRVSNGAVASGLEGGDGLERSSARTGVPALRGVEQLREEARDASKSEIREIDGDEKKGAAEQASPAVNAPGQQPQSGQQPQGGAAAEVFKAPTHGWFDPSKSDSKRTAAQPWDQYDSFLSPTDDPARESSESLAKLPAGTAMTEGKTSSPNFSLDQNRSSGNGNGGGGGGRGAALFGGAGAGKAREPFGAPGGGAVRDLARKPAGQRGENGKLTETIAGVPIRLAQQQGQQQQGQAAAPAPAPVEQPQQPPQAARKIIRNGEMTFEVDSYDSSVVQITKISAEEGGFVSTTQSEKLPNGKVTGSVVVRCPPERLDTLVLKLRGLGDLKTSRVAATDITKQYTDLDSQLRAGRAMESRLLDVIKSGKGEIKDLLEAEKQLGTWREKIERLEGEIRYYNNLVALSTLTITLAERDVRAAALLTENEQVDMGLEAEDVEKARAAAIKTIDDAKGRIVQSDLKKHDAGQFSAVIVAEIAPDAAGPALDRLKQLGRVSRLEVQRRQATAEGTGTPVPGARVDRKETRLQLSIYNLADVKPRTQTAVQLAAQDVEKAHAEVLAQIQSAGGRVRTSELTKPTPDQTAGKIEFESPAAAAEVLLGAVRATGEVMQLNTTVTPDTRDVTDAKRGFVVQIQSLATVAARELTSLRLAARDVPESFDKLRDAVRAAGGRVIATQLAESDPANISGTLDFEVKRDNVAAIESALGAAGAALSRSVSRSDDTQNTVDSKVRFQVQLADERNVQPRETVSLRLAVDDVPVRYDALLAALRETGARVVSSQIDQQQSNHNATATVEIDARRDNRAAVEKALSDAGGVYGRNVSRPAQGQNVLDDKVRLNVTLGDADVLPPRERTEMGIEVRDIAKAAGDVEATAVALGGRKVTSTWGQDPAGGAVARVELDVPLARAPELLAKARDQGRVLAIKQEQLPTAPDGKVGRARLLAAFATTDPIVQGNQGFGASIRSGLATSVQWLLRSVTLIVIGLCLVAPWAIVLWVVWKLWRRRKVRKQEVVAPVATA